MTWVRTAVGSSTFSECMTDYDAPPCLVCAVMEPLNKRNRQRIKHAVAQIDHALTDSRIDGAAAAWLRTIRSGLLGSDLSQDPPHSSGGVS